MWSMTVKTAPELSPLSLYRIVHSLQPERMAVWDLD